MVLRQRKMICLEVNKRLERFQSRILSIHAAGGGQAPGTCVNLGFSESEKTLFVLQRTVDDLEATTLLYTGKFP